MSEIINDEVIREENSEDAQEHILKILERIKNKYKGKEKTEFTEEDKKEMHKKLLAMKELRDGEVMYIEDMKLWDDGFRKLVLNMHCLNAKQKYMLNEHIFVNLSEILKIHQNFFSEASKLHYYCLKRHNDKNGIKTDPALINSDHFVIPLDEFVDVDDLEYATMDLKFFFQAVKCYTKYVKGLPRAIYEFEKIMKENAEFKKYVDQWFEENGVANLGPNHFFYRPTTKIARYEMLNMAIIKHEKNPRNLELYQAVNEGLGNTVSFLDDIYKERSEFFKIYTFYNLLKYTNEKYGLYDLKLMQEKTQVIFNQQLIVKKTLIHPASYKQVILINDILIICKTRDSDYDEIQVDAFPMFLSKYEISRDRIKFFDTADELTKYFPIYFIQTETLDIKGIYFTDKYSRNNAYEIFKKYLKEAVPNPKDHMVKLVKNNKFECDYSEVTCILNINNDNAHSGIKQMYNYKGELNFEIEENDETRSVNTERIEWCPEMDYQKRYLLRETKAIKEQESFFNKNSSAFKVFKNILFDKFYETNKDKDVDEIDENNLDHLEESLDIDIHENTKCCGLVKANDFVTIDLKFDKSTNPGSLDNVTIFSTSSGIFKVHHGQTTKLWNQEARKILYGWKSRLLFYQIGEILYISPFEPTTTALKPQKINLKISNFFIGQVDDCHHLILTVKSDFKFILLYVLQIEIKDKFTQIKFEKSMYVGSNTTNINFINNKFVVASKDFEVVDTQTLRMQKLIEMYDPFTNAFLKPIVNLNARNIFKMQDDLYLVCFSGVGFYIDGMGRYVNTHLSFNWQDEAYDFRICEKWIVVLSLNYVSIFCLETGKLHYQFGFKFGQFVINSEKIRIYNNKGVYNLIITKNLEKIAIAENAEYVLKKEAESKKTKAESDDAVVRKTTKKPRTGKIKVKTSIAGSKAIPSESKEESIMIHNKGANVSMETICDILAGYEEKYRNYKLISLKLVGGKCKK